MATYYSLQDVLKARASAHQSRNIIIYGSHDLLQPITASYGFLYAEASRRSQVVRSLDGFDQNRTVLLHLVDHWDTIVWFWSILLADGVPVLSTSLSNVDEHRHEYLRGLSDLLQSPICITAEEYIPLLDGNHSLRLITIQTLSIMAPQAAGIVNRIEKYNGGTETAVLMLTSGSTGTPKAVCLTHDQIFAAVKGKASVRALPLDRPFLNWIGLSHVASMVEIHLQALWLGVGQIHIDSAQIVSSPRIFLDLLSRHHVSRSFAPNFFLARLVMDVSLESHYTPVWDLSDLVILASGGEANDVYVCKAASQLFSRHGAPQDVITPGFGMTETCAGAIFNLDCPDYDIDRGSLVTSLGKCMQGIEMRVTVPVSGNTRALAGSEDPGDLEVRGSVLFKEYYRNPVATAEAFTQEGWFRTGDQATIDSKGCLHLVGRVKDIVNINGVKFALSEIQTMLERDLRGLVNRVVCFSSRAKHTEQVTVAYIPTQWDMRPESRVEVDRVAVETCFTITGSHPLVFMLAKKSYAVLPYSALGKISGHKMRMLYETGMFSDDIAEYQRASDEFKRRKRDSGTGVLDKADESEAQLIIDIAATLGVETDTIGVETIIFDLGTTSMDLVRLKRRLDLRLNFPVPLVTLMRHPTPRSLSKAIGEGLLRGSFDAGTPDAMYDPVITFRSSGSKTPLWLIHPGVGEVLVFTGLAKHLHDDDRPIYALRARGLDAGQTRFASISEAVSAYKRAIRRHQPKGPYAIAGYSYGTMLAFEIAKELDADEGKSVVGFLGSLNLPPHIKSRMQQLNWNMCLLHLCWFLDMVTETYVNSVNVEEFQTTPCEEAFTQVLQAADKDRMQELGLGNNELSRWADVAFGLQSMAIEYEPRGSVECLDVFHALPLRVAANSRQEWMRDHLSKWSDFCHTQPRFHEVGGAHYTMIQPAYIASFGIILKAALQARHL